MKTMAVPDSKLFHLGVKWAKTWPMGSEFLARLKGRETLVT